MAQSRRTRSGVASRGVTAPESSRDIENYLKGRQHLSQVIRFTPSGDDPHLTLAHEFDQSAFDRTHRQAR